MAARRRALIWGWMVAAGVLAVLLGVDAWGSVARAQQAVTVPLGPGRDGSQTGVAVMTAEGDQTEVVIEIEAGPAGVAQPAHIHEGSCAEVGPVKFPLRDVIDGESATEVTVPLADLQAGNLSINVHKSQGEAGVYVACGNIPGASAPASGVSASSPAAGAPVSGTGGFLGRSEGRVPAWWYALVGGGGLLTFGGIFGLWGTRRQAHARRAAVATVTPHASVSPALWTFSTSTSRTRVPKHDLGLPSWSYRLLAGSVLFTMGLLALRKAGGRG